MRHLLMPPQTDPEVMIRQPHQDLAGRVTLQHLQMLGLAIVGLGLATKIHHCLVFDQALQIATALQVVDQINLVLVAPCQHSAAEPHHLMTDLTEYPFLELASSLEKPHVHRLD